MEHFHKHSPHPGCLPPSCRLHAHFTVTRGHLGTSPWRLCGDPCGQAEAKLENREEGLGTENHTYNPSYLGG